MNVRIASQNETQQRRIEGVQRKSSPIIIYEESASAFPADLGELYQVQEIRHFYTADDTLVEVGDEVDNATQYKGWTPDWPRSRAAS